MRFIQHPSNSRVLGAPVGWDQQALECGALPITDSQVQGQPAMVSFWQPDEEDLRQIASGKPVRLWVLGTVHPPVIVDVEPTAEALARG